MVERLGSTYQIAGRTAPNRFAAQPIEVNSADTGGGAGDTVISRYVSLAEGKWGIVFVEATSVTEKHIAHPHGLVLSEKNLTGFKNLVEAFKSVDESCLLMIQLTHSGRLSGASSQKVKAYEGKDPEIPVLTEKELDEVVRLHIEAADLAKEAGFDGIDVKACHGYLGTELLRPLNRRDDKYGGSLENRAHLISSVIECAARKNPGLIVGTRMSVYEGLRGGCGTSGPDEIIEDLEDIRQIAALFVAAGARFLDISGGAPVYNSRLTQPAKNETHCRYSQFRYAKQFKEWFPQTAIIGSAYTTGDSGCLGYADENISKGYVDFAGFGRQNLSDPGFPAKINEEPGSIQYCTLCGRCSKLLSRDEKVYCVHYNRNNPYL